MVSLARRTSFTRARRRPVSRSDSLPGNSQGDGNPMKIKVSTCFPGKEEKEAPPGFEPGMADLQSAALPLGEGADESDPCFRYNRHKPRHDFNSTKIHYPCSSTAWPTQAG